MAQIKGTALRGLLKFAREGGHPGGIPGALAALPDATRAHFDRKILASAWYPYEAYAGLLTVFAPGGTRSDAQLHQLGRWLAVQDAGTTFKVVSLFASVETMLQRAGLFWSRHCDTGTFETTSIQKGSGGGVLRDFPDVSPLHCRLLTGWIEGMAEAAGAAKAQAEKIRCVHRGDPVCEYRGSWV
jgi:hypothetical protein